MSFCQNCSPHDRAEWRLCGFYMLVREATAADNTEEKTTMPCFPCFVHELIQPFGGSSRLIARRRLFCVKLSRCNVRNNVLQDFCAPWDTLRHYSSYSDHSWYVP
jgi:hypothetical protein